MRSRGRMAHWNILERYPEDPADLQQLCDQIWLVAFGSKNIQPVQSKLDPSLIDGLAARMPCRDSHTSVRGVSARGRAATPR
eukprot:2228208-Pyramimonas_sp.AAC.1